MTRHYAITNHQPTWADTPTEAAHVIAEQERHEDDQAQARIDAEGDLVLALEAAWARRAS